MTKYILRWKVCNLPSIPRRQTVFGQCGFEGSILLNQKKGKGWKYFCFYWRGQKYTFTSLIRGLRSSPLCFTKILKPVYATLRRKGHISTAYIDDSCLQGRTKQQCAQNVSDTVRLLDNLGFTVHDKKSILIPTK